MTFNTRAKQTRGASVLRNMLSAIIAKSAVAVVLNELVTAIDCISGKEFIHVCVCVCVCVHVKCLFGR